MVWTIIYQSVRPGKTCTLNVHTDCWLLSLVFLSLLALAFTIVTSHQKHWTHNFYHRYNSLDSSNPSDSNNGWGGVMSFFFCIRVLQQEWCSATENHFGVVFAVVKVCDKFIFRNICLVTGWRNRDLVHKIFWRQTARSNGWVDEGEGLRKPHQLPPAKYLHSRWLWKM